MVQLPQLKPGGNVAASQEAPRADSPEASSWRGGQSSTSKSKHAYGGWQKIHPLEGDGLLSNLYNHLWKKDKNFLCCQVRIPDTVVYEHNFPRGWYSYDPKSNELVKKIGKDLDTSSIYSHFGKLPKGHIEDVDICCQFIYSSTYGNDIANTVTSVEFFTPNDLFHFLNERKQRPDGILQKFLLPKSKGNSQIQAVWSPKVCIVQRRENRHPINDRYVAQCERYVTFDGPTHLTEEGFCAPKTKEQIKNTCENIVYHFNATEHKVISRMVLYFKVDQHDNIWLLWASSLRVASSRHHPSQRVPLNLSPSFVSPSIAEKNDQQLHEWDSTLLAMDLKQYTLSHDIIFAKSICSGGMPRGSSPRIATTDMKKFSPRSKNFYLSHAQRRTLSPVKAADEPTQPVQPSPPVRTASLNSSVSGGESNWHHTHPAVTKKYQEIITEIAIVDHAVQDLLYTIYSHFLNSSVSFILNPPDDLVTRTSRKSVEGLMAALHCDQYMDTEDTANKMTYRITYISKLPVSQMHDIARSFVHKLKAKKMNMLKSEMEVVIAGGGDHILLPTPPGSRPSSMHQPRPPSKTSSTFNPRKGPTTPPKPPPEPVIPPKEEEEATTTPTTATTLPTETTPPAEEQGDCQAGTVGKSEEDTGVTATSTTTVAPGGEVSAAGSDPKEAEQQQVDQQPAEATQPAEEEKSSQQDPQQQLPPTENKPEETTVQEAPPTEDTTPQPKTE